MGYYTRILSKSRNQVSASELIGIIEKQGFQVEHTDREPQEDVIEELLVKHVNGDNIVVVDRNEVADGPLAEEELEEFVEEIEDAYPKSSVEWLKKYFKEVKVIYSFQILNGAYEKNGWDAIDTVSDYIKSKVGGITQADNEGFYNEEGFLVLWQLSDDIKGKWNVAVLNNNGSWTKFEMDLGNMKHRKEFMAGKAPMFVKKFK